MSRAQELAIDVAGMTSERCEARVAEALLAVPGVSAARANHAEGRAVVTANLAHVTEEDLLQAVRHAGYDPGEVLTVE